MIAKRSHKRRDNGLTGQAFHAYVHTGPRQQMPRWEKALAFRMRHGDPEAKLWAAVLADAIRLISRTPFVDLWKEAVAWVLDRSPAYDLGSFDGVCLVLGLDEAIVREDLCKRAHASKWGIELASKAA